MMSPCRTSLSSSSLSALHFPSSEQSVSLKHSDSSAVNLRGFSPRRSIAAQICSDLTDHDICSLFKSLPAEQSGSEPPLTVVNVPLEEQPHYPDRLCSQWSARLALRFTSAHSKCSAGLSETKG